MPSNASANFHVSYSSPFIASYKELKRRHYRKDKKSLEALEDQIAKYVGLLGVDPRPPIEIAREYSNTIKEIAPQQYNSSEYVTGCDFRKLYFLCPGLQRQASMGRLMYLIDDSRRAVYLFLIYTHEQYQKRPPDKVMNEAFKKLRRERG